MLVFGVKTGVVIELLIATFPPEATLAAEVIGTLAVPGFTVCPTV